MYMHIVKIAYLKNLFGLSPKANMRTILLILLLLLYLLLILLQLQLLVGLRVLRGKFQKAYEHKVYHKDISAMSLQWLVVLS